MVQRAQKALETLAALEMRIFPQPQKAPGLPKFPRVQIAPGTQGALGIETIPRMQGAPVIRMVLGLW